MGKCLQDHLSVRGDGFTVFHGSNLDVLPFMADNSVDSIVCDPPYELGFMGKKWDSTGIAYSVELWQECLRVLKPGGHLLAFSGSRTYHRMVVAIEDAGFEIRDMVSWISNKTFPKSLDISKAIDKAACAEREVIGQYSSPEKTTGKNTKNDDYGFGVGNMSKRLITSPATDEAKQWAGWGTALKPTVEPVVMARKPLIGTVTENVLTWGVGGLNIDASRIGAEERHNPSAANIDREAWRMNTSEDQGRTAVGRWPANIILDEYTAGLLDKQQEEVSRFFYVAKASKRDRNEGLDELEGKEIGAKGNGLARTCASCNASVLDGYDCPDRTFVNPTRQNFHPTVKPTDLMRYLIKLVTPVGGTVLDPFTGSGSTGKAALLDGYQFVGIELTEEYLPIIKGRLTWAANYIAEQKTKQQELEKETLF
jgi:site-specific DNA-methyltransferase (adenine-specific)